MGLFSLRTDPTTVEHHATASVARVIRKTSVCRAVLALVFAVVCSACAAADDLVPTAESAEPTEGSAPPASLNIDTTTTALVTLACSNSTPCPTDGDPASPLDTVVGAANSTQTTPPATPACAVTLTEIVPGSSSQATLYAVSLPASLVGGTISLVVDGTFTVDVQDSVAPAEFLSWQTSTGDLQPSPDAGQIVALAEADDGTTSSASCPIPPGVIESALTPEQSNGFADPGVLTAYQASLDAKISTGGVPKKGYGDTVRSIALPTPHHTVLIAYQRDRCSTADSCPSDSRTRPTATETTSLYCVDIKGTQSTLVGGVTSLKDQYVAWPSVAQVASDMSRAGWCQ